LGKTFGQKTGSNFERPLPPKVSRTPPWKGWLEKEKIPVFPAPRPILNPPINFVAPKKGWKIAQRNWAQKRVKEVPYPKLGLK